MEYRPLGNTGLRVSAISLGCSGFWGQPRFPEARAHRVVFDAFDNGVNLFDTGHNYSHFHAEPRLGRALQHLLASHHRDKLIISSKAGTIAPSMPLLSRSRAKLKDFSPDAIESSCIRSIHNLHCKHLDLFHLHGISHSEITDDLLLRLQQMRARGLFRFLGVNTHAEADMRFIAQHPDIFDVVLLDYSVLQLDREPIIASLHAAGIGVLAGTVLAQGHIIPGKIGRVRTLADLWYLARALLKRSSRRLARNALPMRRLLASLHNLSPVQAAFAYVLRNPAISSCIFGTTQTQNLLEALSSLSSHLSPNQVSAIQSTFASSCQPFSQ